MANVNIPLSVSDGVKKIYLEDYENNIFKVKSEIIPPSKETEIGDIYDADFKPQIKIKRWNNDANLSVRIAGLPEGEETVFTAGDKIKHRKGYIETRFFLVETAGEEDKHEMDVVLFEKPTGNIVQFTIASKNLVFYKQGELTEQEIADGCERPDDVVGSYAVYHKNKVNDVWLESKAMHIYRPKIWDATGREIWGDIDIQAEQEGQFGTLTITIDQQFLNTAIYPVTVDPTFGYTTGGASSRNNIANTATGNIFTAPQNGRMYQMAAYMSNGGAGKTAQAACYYGNQDLFGYVNAPIEIPLSPGWVLFTEGAGPAAPDFAITANNNYYLVTNNNSSSSRFYYDTVAGSVTQSDAQTYNTWDDPGNFTANANNRRWSVYASYIITHTLDTAAVTLGASKRIKVVKRAREVNLQISVQAPGRYIDAIMAVATNVAAAKDKRSRRLKEVSAPLASDIEKRPSLLKEVAFAMTAALSKRIKKYLDSILVISTNQSKRTEGTTTASIYADAEKPVKSTKRVKTVAISLSASFAYLRSIIRDFAVNISLTADILKIIYKNLSSSVQLTSDEDSINKQEFGASIGLASSANKSTAKDFSVSSVLSGAKAKATYKIFDIILQLLADETASKQKTNSVSASLTAQRTIRVMKSRTATIGLLASINKLLRKAFSVSLTLSSSVQKMRVSILQADIQLFIARTTLSKKLNEATLYLTSSPNRALELLAAVTIALNADVSLGKTYQRLAEASISLAAASKRSVAKSFTEAVNLAADLSSRMAKSLSVALQLDAASSRLRRKMLQAEVALFVARLILAKKLNSISISLSSSPHKAIEMLAVVPVALNSSISLTKVYKRLFSGLLSIVSQITKTSNKGLMSQISLLLNKTKKIDINNVVLSEISAKSETISGKNVVLSGMFGISSNISKHVNAHKESTVLVEGADIRRITGSAGVSVGVSSSSSKRLTKGLAEVLTQLDSQIINSVRKENRATITMTGSGNKKIEGETSTQMVMAGSPSKSIAKEAASSSEMSASAVRAMKNVIGASIILSSERVGDASFTFYSAVNVASEKAAKKIDKNIKIFGGDGGGVNMIPDFAAIIVKTLSAEISLSGDREGGNERILSSALALTAAADRKMEYQRSFAANFSLAGSGSKQVEGETNVIIYISGTSEEQQSYEKTLGASLSMGAKIQISKQANRGITIFLDDQKAVKRVGKTFTIREHTPSVWHNC